MTRPDLTDITVVLDRSGSMASMKEATIESFNGFLNSQRQGAGHVQVSLIQFDDRYEVNYEGQPLNVAPLLNDQTFQPRGSTALLDAIGRTIVATGKRLGGLPEQERPGTVIFVTLTDGQENSSQNYNQIQINSMIAEQRDKYAWQFVFLAANQDAIATAAQIGIGAGQALTMAASPSGIAASIQAVGGKMAKMRASRAAGAVDAQFEFDEADRRAARTDKTE